MTSSSRIASEEELCTSGDPTSLGQMSYSIVDVLELELVAPMALATPDAGGGATCSVDNAGRDLVLAPADHPLRCDNGASSVEVIDSGGEKDFGSSGIGEEEYGGDGRVAVLLDAFAKGSPPPTSGDPSPGRNHEIVDSRVIGVCDGRNSGAEKDDDHVRIVLVGSLVKSTIPPSSGDSSKGRNMIPTGATASVSLQSPNHGVNGHGSDDNIERTMISASGRYGSNPNNQGQ